MERRLMVLTSCGGEAEHGVSERHRLSGVALPRQDNPVVAL